MGKIKLPHPRKDGTIKVTLREGQTATYTKNGLSFSTAVDHVEEIDCEPEPSRVETLERQLKKAQDQNDYLHAKLDKTKLLVDDFIEEATQAKNLNTTGAATLPSGKRRITWSHMQPSGVLNRMLEIRAALRGYGRYELSIAPPAYAAPIPPKPTDRGDWRIIDKDGRTALILRDALHGEAVTLSRKLYLKDFSRRAPFAVVPAPASPETVQ